MEGIIQITQQLLTLKELMDGLDHSTLMDYDTQQYIQKFGDEIIPDTLGLGIFNTFSRMNHSCMPNLEVNYHNNFLARVNNHTLFRQNYYLQFLVAIKHIYHILMNNYLRDIVKGYYQNTYSSANVKNV